MPIIYGRRALNKNLCETYNRDGMEVLKKKIIILLAPSGVLFMAVILQS